MNTRIGQQLGNYKLSRLLGQGGFAEVYLGQHIHLETLAAIKVLPMRLDNHGLEVFRNEARIIVSLTHPNIIRILDFGVLDEVPYLVMEYAPNGTLHQRFPEGTRVPQQTIASYVKQIAAALQYAHDRKLIHRDVKPGNMLLGSNENVLLSDFGLVMVAHSTRSQTTQDISGTLAYAAPEQLRGKPSVLSDQYSLGIVVYEWLCGSRPFQGSFIEVLGQHITSDPPPLYGHIPGITPAVEAVVMRALHKDPRQRFPRVQDFADALEYALLAQQYAPDLSVPQYPTGERSSTTQPQQALYHGSTGAIEMPASPQPAPKATQPVPQTKLLPASQFVRHTAPIDQIATAPEIMPQQKSTAQFPSQPTPTNSLQLPFPTGPMSPLPPVSPTSPLPSIATPGQFIRNGGTGAFLPVEPVASKPAQLAQAPQLTPPPQVHQPLPTAQPSQALQAVQVTPPVKAGKRSPHFSRLSRRQILGLGLGGLVVVGGGGALAAFLSRRHPALGTKLAAYTGHTDTVTTVAWSPDGKYIASGGNDGTIHIWEATTGNRIYIYAGHLHMVDNQASATITALAWSPDGQRIASCGSYRPDPTKDQFLPTVQVWEALSGKLIVTYPGHNPRDPTHSNTTSAVSWSPDGKQIVSAGAFDNTAKIWNAQTGETVTIYVHLSTVSQAQWSPDGTYIATGSSTNSIFVWNARGDLLVTSPYTAYYYQNGFAWSPDGKNLITSGNDYNLHLWDMAIKNEISTDQVSGTYALLAWSPDGRQLAGNKNNAQLHPAIDLLDGQHRAVTFTYTAFSKAINTLAWSPDSTRIAVGGLDTLVLVWQAV